MYMSCTFNMFVYLCISQILLLGFLTTHLAKKHDISSILSGISQYQKHTISLSQGNLKKKPFPLVIKPGMELRIFNGIIY